MGGFHPEQALNRPLVQVFLVAVADHREFIVNFVRKQLLHLYRSYQSHSGGMLASIYSDQIHDDVVYSLQIGCVLVLVGCLGVSDKAHHVGYSQSAAHQQPRADQR